jgi:hypothetical protein
MAGGAMNEAAVFKGGRIHQIAMENRLPTITFTQSVNYYFLFYKFLNDKLTNRYPQFYRQVLIYNSNSVCSTEVVLVSAVKPYSKR